MLQAVTAGRQTERSFGGDMDSVRLAVVKETLQISAAAQR
jgi:hypothetical protein